MSKPCEPISCPEPEDVEINFIAPHYDYYQTCPIHSIFKDQ